MQNILRTKTTVTVYPPTHTGTLRQRGVGYEWMIQPEGHSTPTNTAQGIFNTLWHTGKGEPKLYYVPEPVPFLQCLHSHRQIPTFTASEGSALLLYNAPPRLGGGALTDWNTALAGQGFLFRGAGHRWGLTDIPCLSSGPFGSGPTTLAATVQGIENFTLRVLPVLQYQEGSWSLRVNINQKHFFWWIQQPGGKSGESSYGFHRYTDYAADRSKQVLPAGRLTIRATGNWLQFNFLAFGRDTLLVEVLDHEGQPLRRLMAYDPDLDLDSKDIEIELSVDNGTFAFGVTEHTYTATGAPPETIPDEDGDNDPDDSDDHLALTYPLGAAVTVANTNAPMGAALGYAPEGTSFAVYAQRCSGTGVSPVTRPVVALRSTGKRTPILFGAQLFWPNALDAGSGEGISITGLRAAPRSHYSKDYRHNRLALEYAKGTLPDLKGNECITVTVKNLLEDGTLEAEQPFFGGFVSGYGTSAEGDDPEVRARLEARDWTLRLEKKDMADTPCFGNWPLPEAVHFIFNRCGVSDNLIHWQQSGADWRVPQRALFKLEFKYDETANAVEALDGLLASCGFTWGTGFDGNLYIWSRAAEYVDDGAVIDDTDTDDENKIVTLETRRDLDDFANEVLVVTSALRDKTDPSTARVRNLPSQQDPADDLYIGEDWVRVLRLHDSFRAPLAAALELVRYTHDRRLCAFAPKNGRLDVQPRHIVTANLTGHDFPSGTKFAVLSATYSIPVIGGLPRLRSEFILAK